MSNIPPWVAELEDEDLAFVKRFILASGSLKEVASLYGVSYPTVRLRLDRLIQKIKLTETAEVDRALKLGHVRHGVLHRAGGQCPLVAHTAGHAETADGSRRSQHDQHRHQYLSPPAQPHSGRQE